MPTEIDQTAIDAARPIDDLISEWEATAKYMKQAQEREMYLRKLIADRTHHNLKNAAGYFPEGTTNAGYSGVSHNFAAKVTCPYKREVDETTYLASCTEAKLTAEEQAACFEVEVKLKVKNYKALPEEKRKILDKSIIVKPGSLYLEVQTLPK